MSVWYVCVLCVCVCVGGDSTLVTLLKVKCIVQETDSPHVVCECVSV